MAIRRASETPISAELRTSSPGYSLVELMAFMAVMVTVAAFIMPFTRGALNAMNLTSDARNVMSAVSLAKMRAAASFTKARVVVVLGSNTYYVERWRKNPAGWVAEGVVKQLSPNVSFGFAGIAAPPPNTQPVIGQAQTCLDAADQPITGTACIVFNSRGVPIDGTNAPTPTGAYYMSDGATVFGVTTTTGGMVQLWRSNLTGSAWALN
jgi:type II secretory pathway pseudopilin PulG